MNVNIKNRKKDGYKKFGDFIANNMLYLECVVNKKELIKIV